MAGSAVKWLRDTMSLINSAPEINDLAAKVPDAGGIYFVTAFSGLLAPYWDSGAAGLLIGMSISIPQCYPELMAWQVSHNTPTLRISPGLP